MCPFCLSTVGLIVVGSVSSGGLAALALKVSHKKNNSNEFNTDVNEGNISHVNQQD